MKKILMIMLALALVATLAVGCGSSKTGNDNLQSQSGNNTPAPAPAPNGDADKKPEAADKTFKIGVVQLVEHAALDASYQGFVDGLAEAGYEVGKNITIDFNNAQGEQANANTIASKLVNDKNDLILAIATPAAQAVANATTEIPILITAVTDPADAKLVASNEAPGGNVTGTSDLTPVAAQIELITKVIPNAKKIGLLYNSSEANSEFQANIARAAAKDLGLETVNYTVSNSNEIQQVVESMIGKVDAIYAPTDNMIAAGMTTVGMVANDNNMPVFPGEGGMVDAGGLMTYGLSYYELGKQTGAMAARVLEGADPATMPIEYLKTFDLHINEDTVAKLGITIPDGL